MMENHLSEWWCWCCWHFGKSMEMEEEIENIENILLEVMDRIGHDWMMVMIECNITLV